MSADVLVAGVGNIFRGDDGFGTAVVAWLETHPRPEWSDRVLVKDFGIRGVHLAYELLEGYPDLVLVDTMHRDGEPGSLYVVEPDLDDLATGTSMVDAHDLAPASVLALVPSLGGALGRVTVVGCEPVSVEDGLGLSDVVEGRVPGAGRLVHDVVAGLLGADASTPRPPAPPGPPDLATSPVPGRGSHPPVEREE